MAYLRNVSADAVSNRAPDFTCVRLDSVVLRKRKRGLIMKQDTMLAMILAGGRGSRLHELTSKVAKPAVAYG